MAEKLRTVNDFNTQKKRTSINVNEDLYHALRIRLMASGKSVSRWLQEKMYDEVMIDADTGPEEVEVNYDIVDDDEKNPFEEEGA